MKQHVQIIFEKLLRDYPKLKISQESIFNAFLTLKDCYDNGNKVLICGNGGSAADSEHIVGELMKGFLLKRAIPVKDSDKLKQSIPEEWEYFSDRLQQALPAISLVSQTALLTAYSNDVAPDMIFAQQVYGYGRSGDVLFGISSSGNSSNIINAIKVAKAFSLKTIGLTGKDGGIMKEQCDVTIIVPAKLTYEIQEYHLPVYHALCAMLEAEYFTQENSLRS